MVTPSGVGNDNVLGMRIPSTQEFTTNTESTSTRDRLSNSEL
jgi:hypothetical protein